MIGKTLAHYEITAAIGKGGMGEVYQATDKKLGRSVAIKVLPEEFAQDTERVARFEREAKLLASLNHPNIAAIYGLEQSEGTRFLVLELVEGQTLFERLARGPLPVKESLELAIQIAEALEAAHEKAVIHRDLKPANIKVTSEGKVKVLDFGLAKAYAGTAVGDETVLETLAEGAGSGRGVLLGTPAYMSPEQASRQPADHRSDVWSFGCVLFEMLTGKVLFKSNTLSHTIAAILEREPDFDALPNNLSPAIRRLLERCLEKNPNRRWHAIADVRLEVEAALAGSLPATEFKPRARPILSYAVAILMTALVAIPLAWYLRPLRPEPRAVTRFEFDLTEGEGETPETLFRPSILAMSPDGSQIAMVRGDGLYLRSIDELQARVLPATQGEVIREPFFSPDGRWVGYFSPNDGQLKKVPVGGGEPVFVSEVTGFPGSPSWSPDDSILYVQRDIVDGRTSSRIMRVASNGGNPDRLVERPGALFIFNPTMLPGGRSVLFAAASSASEISVVVRSLESADEKVLFTGGPNLDFLTTGYLVYQLENDVVARRFDAETWELGRPVPLLQGVHQQGPRSSLHFDVSASGSLVYLQGTVLGSGTPVWVGREGNEEEALAESPLGVPQNPRLSPDGSRFAMSVEGDVWVYDVAGRPPIKVTFDVENFPVLTLESGNSAPLWTPDGQRIVYERNSDPSRSLWAVSADGSSAVPEPVSPEGHFHPHGWSADGSDLIATQQLDVPDTDIVHWPVTEPAKLEAVVATPAIEGEDGAAPSPDGGWLAYASDQTGQSEIWVLPYPGPGAPVRVSPNGGTEPVWARNGRELYYLEGNAMMAVAVVAGDGFDFQPPERLFQTAHLKGIQPPSYDVGPDGRFLMIRPVDNDNLTPRRVVVVQNWIEEVTERVPVP